MYHLSSFIYFYEGLIVYITNVKLYVEKRTQTAELKTTSKENQNIYYLQQ